MASEVLTDQKLRELMDVEKRVISGGGKPKIKGQHRERDFEVLGADQSKFRVFIRQNLKLNDDFSCGIRWIAPSGDAVVLARYNGSSHPHPNPLEGTRIQYRCHIHRATERYIAAGRQAETYAEETSAYTDLDGAIQTLVQDFRIDGLVEPEGQLSLKWN